MASITVSAPLSEEKTYRTKHCGDSGRDDFRGIITDVRAAELPDEAFDEFSNAPFEFENTARLLWEDTQKTYYHACTANRFSENYLKYCGILEKNIKKIGSLCLNKAVFEKGGLNFPKLESMTVEELIRMVSYHLRKCHAALDGIYRDNNFLGITYLNWEFRWAELGSRLQATEVKIQKIREGKMHLQSIQDRVQSILLTAPTNDETCSSIPQSLRLNANALPLDGSIGKRMRLVEKEEEKIRARRQRAAEKLEKEAMAFGGFKPFPPLSKKAFQQAMHRKAAETEPVTEKQSEREPEAIQLQDAETLQKEESKRMPRTVSEAEARKILTDRAIQKGDRAAILEIEKEDSLQFHQRWERYAEEVRSENAVRSGRAGPSEAVRKKLREKRKKKK